MTIESRPIKNLLGPVELARLFGVSKTSIYRLVESGQIPYYKIGGSLRFDHKDVVAYMENNRVDSIN